MTEALVEKLNLKTRLGYGIGDIAICLYWSGVGLYLLYFYTDVVGISPSLAGLIYGIGMFWDAITDPFMGYMAERTRTKWGVYRPYLLFGNIPLALSFILLFWVPPLEGGALFFFLLFANLLHRTCFTLVSVPFSSLTPRITSDSQERTNLTGFRMLGAQTGTNLMALLAFPIIFWVGGEDESLGFVVLATIAGLTALGIHAITFLTVKEPSNDQGIERVGGSLSEAAKAIGKNGPFWLVFSATLIVGITTIFFGNNLIYYTKYALNLHEHQGTILFTSGIVAFLSIPIWWSISNNIGKKLTWLISSSITLIALLVFYLYEIDTLSELLFLVAFIGFGSGAGGILFWSMLPDTIEYGEVHTGVRSESSLYGFMTFAQKGSIAFAIIILGLVLDFIGFQANEVQSDTTISNMKAIMTLIPSIGVALSLVIIYFYPIDAKMHKDLLRQLKEGQS
ncbi:MAG: MFS transporter [Gammaproteobacteria bacterium]|jgi:GPH family glycoside/pentoside/hexuronide:cation symporter|nr:MAG: MFS transporter [Gammaproteobacteria bacterium]|tara:strand:+ start:2068 stop:3423 length:1356 start_codon:yes stop_codon:yes gene_type:complete